MRARSWIFNWKKGYGISRAQAGVWCIYDSTALAEAEVEYEDMSARPIWVKFWRWWRARAVARREIKAAMSARSSWTTTPWDDSAQFGRWRFHPDFDYVVVETEKGKNCCCRRSVAALAGGMRDQGCRCRGHFQRPRLRGMEVPRHPFLADCRCRELPATYVSWIKAAGIRAHPAQATAWRF